MDATTWVEVSEKALRDNYAAVARYTGVPVCAVVKANGYGHGIVNAARAFSDASMLAVTRLEEARAIRDAGIDTPILILMPVTDVRAAVALRCEVTVGSVDDIAALPTEARAHLKIDTGMGRLGVAPADAEAAARAITERAGLAGVSTHFADAAGASGAKQLAVFRSVVTTLRHAGMAARFHAANSAAALALPDARFDMVRVGTLLYGQDPPGARAPFPLSETFTWYARVVAVRSLPRGATVGYGSEYATNRPMQVATIPVGWADGFAVEPSARPPGARNAARALKHAVARDPRVVWFGDRAAPVLGRIGMQAITVGIDGVDDVRSGSVARIPARRLMVSPLIERVIV